MSAFERRSALRIGIVILLFVTMSAVGQTAVWSRATAIGRSVAATFGYGGGGAGGQATPVITATMVDAIVGDDGDGKADPGETIRYTATIGVTGADALNVQMPGSLDPNTTLVPGSLVISPIALNDTYQTVGNMIVTTSVIAATCATDPLRSAMCNDTINGATLTGIGATQGTANGTAPGATLTLPSGATVVMSADGSFVYTPSAGFEGADTFWYTLSNAAAPDNAQVTINVGGLNGMVWFVSPAGGGTGRQASPLTLAAFQAINNGTGTNPAAGDTVFLFEGTNTGPVTLLNNQLLVGQDEAGGFPGVGGPALRPGNQHPPLNPTGTTADVTSAGATITLGSGNTLAGFRVTGGTTGIAGGAAGTVQVRNVSINMAGTGISIGTSVNFISSPLFNGFTSVTSTGGANGVFLTGATGTLNINAGALSGHTGNAFHVSGGSATINYSGTITNATALAVNITGKTGGVVTFTGGIPVANASSTSPRGISLTGNAGATINFTGGVALSTGANPAFTATGGGTVSVQQPGAIVNTLATTAGVALNIANTTIGANDVTFRSVSAGTGAGSAGVGISLDNTGSVGGLHIVGLDGADAGSNPDAGSGGTIQHKTGADGSTTGGIGIYLNNTFDVRLAGMQLNDFDNFAIFGNRVTDFRLTDSHITGANGTNVASPFSEGSISFIGTPTTGFGLSGTVAILDTEISGGAQRNVSIDNATGTMNLNFLRNNVHHTSAVLAGDDGFALEADTSAVVFANISNNTFTAHGGDHFNLSLVNNANVDLTFKNNDLQGGYSGFGIGGQGLLFFGATYNGTFKYDISNNGTLADPFTGNKQGGAIHVNKGSGTGTFSGQIVNNVIGDPAVPNSGSEQAFGIVASARGAGGSHTTLITNNVVREYFDRGILLQAGEGAPTFVATVTNNSVSDFGDAINSLHGVHLDFGILSGDDAQITIDVRNNLIANAGNEPQGGFDFRMRTAGLNDVFIAGYTGGNSAANAQAFIDGQNPDGTTFSVAQAASGTYNNGPAVPLPPPNLPVLPPAPMEAPAMTMAERSVSDVPLVQSTRRVTLRAGSFSADRANARLRGGVALLVAAARNLITTLQPATLEARQGGTNVPAGKQLVIRFDVTVNGPTPFAQYSAQGTVTGSNFASKLTDDPDFPGSTDPTVTLGDRFNTLTSLGSLKNPAFQGESVTFGAIVTPTEGTGLTPNGTVQFKDGAANLGSAVTCAASGTTCTASFTTSALSPGTHSITAEYSGGTNHDPSTSAPVSQVIIPCSASVVVTTNADSGAGSLRQALVDACPAGTITFDMGTVVSPIGLTTARLSVTRNVTISGPGANVLTVQRTGGSPNFGVFSIDPAATAAISGLTISGGQATGVSNSGGGIFNQGTLTVSNAAVLGNTAQFGGGIANNLGNLTLVNSTIAGNTALGDGAGIINTFGTLAIVNSTISGNAASAGGGALFNVPSSPSVTITNATVTNNRADTAGVDATGGGLHNSDVGTAVTLRNTLVAGNFLGASPSTTADDVSGVLAAASAHNLIGTNAGMTGVTNGTNGNIVGAPGSEIDPRLGPLANHGGGTETHATLPASPALDAGDNTFVVAPPFPNTSPITDQRGTGFARIRDAADADTTQTVDIGAFEADPSIENITDKLTAEDTPLAVGFNVGDGASPFDPFTATSSNQAVVPDANLNVTGSGSTRTLNIAPAPNASGTATITVTATKTIGGTPVSMADTFVITVSAVADVPSVTNATTLANVQTTSGLVVTKNAADGAEVTHFKVTNITGGTLFQNDGTTPIANGEFITVAQGGAGLKFTPTTGSTATGGFDVQSAIGASEVGISGTAHATITVDKHTTSTTIQSDAPDPSANNTPYPVTVVVASTTGGPAPTGTVNVTDGTNNCVITLDGLGQGACSLTPSAPGPYTITATYGGDAVSLGSSDTEAHEVLNCPANPIVTSTADSGAGTFRQALIDACTGDTITFNLAPGATIELTGTDPIISGKALTIAGPGAHLLNVARTSSPGRLLMIDASAAVTVSGLTMAGGSAPTGGAIVNGGVLTLSGVTLSGNTAAGMGGAILHEGVQLTVRDAILSGNTAAQGGAIAVDGGAMTIANSTISGNTALSGGGLLLAASDTTVVTNSTITSNRAHGSGGGIQADGPGDVTLRNTLVAGNLLGASPSTTASDIAGAVHSGSANNLIGTNAGMSGVIHGVNGNIVGAPGSEIDPRLGPLAHNGGPTFTHALLAGSPALDTGDNALAAGAGLTLDQRGLTRLSDGPDANSTDTVDIGAVEAGASLTPLPDLTIQENGGGNLQFNVADADLITSVIATSLNSTLVPNGPPHLEVHGTGGTRTLVITPSPNVFGTAEITVTVASGSDTMSDTLLLTVNPTASAPTVTPASTNEDTQTTSGLVITRNALDGPEVTHFKITQILGGALYENDGTTPIANGTFITAAQGGAGLKFTPAPNTFGSATFRVEASTSASDSGLGSAAFGEITVNPVADTPSVTHTLTFEDTQTADPLVVRRNTADGGEVTHFKITAITNGSLFHSDGVTPIPNGSFIAAAPVTTLLRFTPSPNAFGSGSFTVQASTSASDAGLAGGTATSTITILPVGDPPTITAATTNEDTQTVSGLVVARNAVDGAEITHFRFSGIVNGSLFKNNGTTPIGEAGLITVAEGAAGLKFTPAPNFFGTASFNVQSVADQAGTPIAGPPTPATVTVLPLADTPSITNASTTPGTQTTSGLVVSRNAADGAEVTHFKVTGITGGNLFQNNGTTPIANGAFITFAQANAGLKFTPTSTSTGHVTVQASLSASDAGLGGGTATADIVISSRTITIGADAPSLSLIRRLTSSGSLISGPTAEFVAFDGNSGVRVAEADITADGVPDVVAGTGFGVPSRVKVFDGATGAVVRDFSPGFSAGGVFVAAGDVDGDGAPDIVTGDNGGSSIVRVFSGASGAPVWVQSFGDAFTGGVRVASGDVNGDGYADLIVGNGPGAASTVRVLSGVTHAELRAFSPYGGFVGGVHVAAGDVNGDGFADVITAAGGGGGPHVKVFDGVTGSEQLSFFAFDPSFTGGVRVAAGDVNGDGRADILAAQGPGGNQVRAFSGATGAQIGAPMTAPTTDGAFVSSAVPVNRMVIEAPASGGSVGSSFELRGWAFEEGTSGTGIDIMHVYAYPVSGAAPTFLGWGILGDPRPDIGAIFGAQYTPSGWHLDVTGLAEGTYDVAAFARSSATGIFNMVRVVRVQVVGPGADLRIALDGPPVRTVLPNFRLSGWAFDIGSTRPDSGVEYIHVYAFPNTGGAAAFLGWGTLGDSRPDVAAVFGPRAAQSGWHLDVTGLAPGGYTVAAYPKGYANPFFSPPVLASVTVSATATTTVEMSVDTPSVYDGKVAISGWALSTDGIDAARIDTVQVWAYPIGGGEPVFKGEAAVAASRPEAAAMFGPKHEASGFAFELSGLSSGTWDLAILPRAGGQLVPSAARVVRVTIP